MNEIYKNIYQIDVTLPKSPLKLLHSYIIRGENRNLIVDTGFNDPQCKDDLFRALYELGVDLDYTDIFLTHSHADHSGLVCSLLTGKNKVYCSDIDGTIMNGILSDKLKDMVNINLDLSSTPQPRRLDYKNHPAMVFVMDRVIDYTPVSEGDIIEIGEYKFKVIDLPGHTQGQCGLYEENHKIFFCGDHILNKITPNIIFWNFEQDSLQIYKDSLEKVKAMDVKYLYSAHRDMIENHIKRINQILLHHERRLKEIVDFIDGESKTAYEIAQAVTWDFGDGDFEKFGVQQVWFAVSEVLAHLENLRHTGVLEKVEIDGEVRYKKLKIGKFQ
jgi:glyoxylase-like metal-dependent hydrolase (beta-lactamase superfamily II)